jgi:hypothetical protein
MKSLTLDTFKEWMETYGRASKENDTQTSAELFALDAKYYESPFDEPLVGQKAIYQYWDKGAQTLKDKQSDYEILAIQGNLGIERWRTRFTHISSGQRVALDCIFLVEFDEDLTCRSFREWWHSQEIEAGSIELS